MLTFTLDDEQETKLEEWSHHCTTYGRITITFTNTGLGQIAEAECICGEKLSLTDFEDW